MMTILTIAFLVLLGLLVINGPFDSREADRSKEQDLAGYGMAWETDVDDDQALAREWQEALHTLQVRRLEQHGKGNTDRPDTKAA